MKAGKEMKWYYAVPASIAVMILFVIASPTVRSNYPEGDYFYKITTGGVQSGYAVVDTSMVTINGIQLLMVEQVSNSMSRLLGMDVNSEIKQTFLLDPETKELRSHRFEGGNGDILVSWGVDIDGSKARCTSSIKEDEMVIDLPPDVIVDNGLYFDRMLADFVDGGLEEKVYKILSVADQEIQEIRCSKQEFETLGLAGNEYSTLVVDNLNLDTGALVRMWVDTETAMLVKLLQQDGNVVTLADKSVVEKTERVDMDKYIMTDSDVAIADVTGITHMKVKAKIRPIGMRLTPEMLTVPGQTYTGTVEDNLIEGVFEIEHERYDGSGAPPFPPDFSEDSEAREYLKVDGIFEADDPILIEKARELTDGSANSWEAACRLSEWVSKEIAYQIPGGGTARNTYDMRAGECGAHSILLATFCRSVGIPSRMVWGCMYSPNLGGTFGQHAWTEIYMGDAGWIPVDATAGEINYVDSGHIRIACSSALGSSLNAKEFEILEYEIRGRTPEEMAAAATEYDAYLGKYEYPGSGEPFEVLVMDGGLAIDIPNRALLALKDPDEIGRWFAKMTDRVYLTFDENESGQVTSFAMHEMYRAPKTSPPNGIDESVPDEVRPFLGVYTLAAAKTDLTVSYKDDVLSLHHSLRRTSYALRQTGEGGWASDNSEYTLYFEPDRDGEVASIKVDAGNEFKKK